MPLLIVSEPPPASTSLPLVSMPAFSTIWPFGSPMTGQDAENYLSTYRAWLNAWTMAVAGLSEADCDALHSQLAAGQRQLVEIALTYPEKSYLVDMLINSCSRTWAGLAIERVPQTAHR